MEECCVLYDYDIVPYGEAMEKNLSSRYEVIH